MLNNYVWYSFGYIRPHLLRPGTGVDRETLDDCVKKGYIAALGVGMQGIFTLTPIITPLCFLHWAGAAIFAGAAQAHATVAIEVYEKAIASAVSPVRRQFAEYTRLFRVYNHCGWTCIFAKSNSDSQNASVRVLSESIQQKDVDSRDTSSGSAAAGMLVAGIPAALGPASPALAARLLGRTRFDADASARSIHGAVGSPDSWLLGQTNTGGCCEL